MRTRAAIPLLACALAAGSCSAPEPPGTLPASQPATGDEFRIGDADLVGDPGSASTLLPPGESCLGEARAVEHIGLDMFLMLDLSGSMLDPLPAAARLAGASNKWDAVRASLESFVQAPEASEIGIGLQYFPLSNPGVSFACSSGAECGDGACTNTLCVVHAQTAGADGGAPLEYLRVAGDQGTLCRTDADCPAAGESCQTLLGACVFPPGALADHPQGHFANVSDAPETSFVSARCSSTQDCAGVPGTRCETVGLCTLSPVQCSDSVPCPAGAGLCQPFPYTCANFTSCDTARYAEPAVAIDRSSTRAGNVITSLRAQVPLGATPTGPALAGALAQARSWADQHPERQMVTVLATDGFPTVCEPLEIPALAELARGGLPVRTFVIAVFSDEDLDADGRQRLDQIASAGGSERALVVNTAGDLTSEFLAALNQIRSTAVSCDFALDAGARLDFDRVNLRLLDSAGSARELLNVGDASACGDEPGWHYVRDASGLPVQVSVCPASCEELRSGRVSAELQIGCVTRIR